MCTPVCRYTPCLPHGEAAPMGMIPFRWERSRLGGVGARTCSSGLEVAVPEWTRRQAAAAPVALSHSWLTKPACLLGVCKFPVLKASLPFVCPADGSCWFAHSGFKFTILLRIDCFSAAQSKQCQIHSLLQPFAAVKVEHSGASGVCLWSQGTSY